MVPAPTVSTQTWAFVCDDTAGRLISRFSSAPLPGAPQETSPTPGRHGPRHRKSDTSPIRQQWHAACPLFRHHGGWRKRAKQAPKAVFPKGRAAFLMGKNASQALSPTNSPKKPLPKAGVPKTHPGSVSLFPPREALFPHNSTLPPQRQRANALGFALPIGTQPQSHLQFTHAVSFASS